jgi:hypothetical protein
MDGQPLIDQFQDDIEVVVDKYRDVGLDFGSIIGTLEMCKLDLWSEAHSD